MSRIISEREALMDMLTDMIGDLVAVVTIDAQEARPLPGKVAVLIDPPNITYEGWQFVNTEWTVNLIDVYKRQPVFRCSTAPTC